MGKRKEISLRDIDEEVLHVRDLRLLGDSLAFGVPGEDISNEWLEPVSDEEYAKLG